MRWTVLIALALAAPAAAQTGEPQTPQVSAVAWSYGLVSDRPTTKELVARLDRLCASKRQRDQRRCEESWHVINAAHAELQAKKAAQTD
ncbi:MAG: hypothetical protein RL519_1150 [Pseudomonadota bacterium]|jgi:hypothetical protein